MPKIYRISRAALRVFYKVRHHRGHGIHSPFVYALITKVIEEKRPYYFYSDLKVILEENKQIHEKVTKYNLLSFRLVNYFNPSTIIEIGSGEGLNALCLTAPSGKIECTVIEASENKSKKAELLFKNRNQKIKQLRSLESINEIYDCIYLNMNNSTVSSQWIEHNLLKLVGEQSFIIIKGIRTKKRNHLLWNKLKDSDKVTVSLDLYNMGVLFFDPKLYKRNYKISF